MLIYTPEHAVALVLLTIMVGGLALLYLAAAVQSGVKRLRRWWRQ